MRVALKSFLDGNTPAVETCWFLLPETNIFKCDLFTEDDRRFLLEVVSKTNHLPVGQLRENWHPDALPEKLAQLADYEAGVRPPTLELCTRLMISLKEKQRARVATKQPVQSSTEGI